MSDQVTGTVAPEALDKQATVAETATTEIKASTNIDFMSLIDEGLRSQGNIKDFKDASSLAKSYLELQKMVGGSVRIPSKDATPEAKQEFLNKIKDIDGVLLKNDEKLYEKLGRPDKPENYKLEVNIKNEFKESLDPEINKFKDVAYSLGLTNEQATGLVNMKLKEIEAAEQTFNESKQKGKEALQKLWGQDYDNRLQAAKQVAKIYGEKFGDDIKKLVQGPAGNNPALLHMLSELAETYKEKGHEGMSSTDLGMTPELARQKIMERRNDIGFKAAYNDAKHPGHAKAVAEMEALYRLL